MSRLQRLTAEYGWNAEGSPIHYMSVYQGKRYAPKIFM